jgi:hypothetical protein
MPDNSRRTTGTKTLREPKKQDTNCPKSGTKPTETAPFDTETPQEYYDKPYTERMLTTQEAPEGMPTKKTRKMGRPTKYKPIYCQQIIKFFDRPYTYESECVHTNKKGETWTSYQTKANPVPLMCAFAEWLGVGTTTLQRWEKEYSDFRAAITRAQELQLNHLSAVTGMGLYNSNWAVFMAKNISKWRDKKDIEHSGQVDSSIFVNKMAQKALEAEADENALHGGRLN